MAKPPQVPSKSENSVGVVAKYGPENWLLQMYKVTPEHSISKLEISLLGDSSKSTTANISYEITAIEQSGDKLMEEFTEEWYEHFMMEWDKQMNYYLGTDKKITS